ncbi:MAG: aminofutalosine synthase MqnE, partial [Bacteroidota bacterium]
MPTVINHLLGPEHALFPIFRKVADGIRIDKLEALRLYESAELSLLGGFANLVRERKNGNNTYFNRNFHIEPTNICVFSCNFCSYSRTLKER